VATPNYGYDKRQKELAKKRKKEEKLKNRAERKVGDMEGEASPDGDHASSDDSAADQEPA